MAHQDLLEIQESQVSQDLKDLREFPVPPAAQGLKVNPEHRARSSLQRGHRRSPSQAHRDLLEPWDPQDLQVPQALPAQLVSQDSKAHEGSEGWLATRSWVVAAPSPRSSLLKVLIYEVPQAHLDHVGHQGPLFQAHQDPEAHQGKAHQAHQALQDLP